MVAAVVAIAATVLLVQGAHAAGAAEAPPSMTSQLEPHRATSIAFPASVPVGGTGLITVSYAAPTTTTLPPDSGDTGGGFVLLRFPAGIEVASPGYAVYPGTVEMGGHPGEFAVFHAKKALPATGAGEGIRTVEIEIRVSEPPLAPRNFVDVRVVGAGGDGGAAAGALAILETSGGTVHFDVKPAPAAAGSDSAESVPARDMSSGPNSAAPLPPPTALAVHLARAIPPGADAALWLAENAARLPADYREKAAAEYRRLAGDTPLGAGGASGQSSAPLPFPSLSSYVYGTLYSRTSNGTLGVQPGASVCMYDVGDDNRTLTLLDNLADPADPRGACTATDDAGFFDMSVLTLDPTDPLSDVDLRMVFAADGPLYRIADAGNRTYELHGTTVGNLSDAVRGFNVTVPDGHKFRRAMWMGDAIAAAHARLGSEFGHAAPKADVRWDPALPDGSSYNHTSGAMTVSSVHARAGAQHGAEAVPASILHEYAHHVLAHVRSQAGDAQACPGHLRIDRPHSEECAWTDGWAHFAAAAMLGSRTLGYHHLPLAVDLEAPAYDIGGRHVYGFAAGADVPGNVAGALWDLYDTADEPGDAVSGAGAAVWNATVSMRHGAGGSGSGPSILDFRQAWLGSAGNPPLRGVLELNGIDVPPDAPPALAASNTRLAVPYGGTARTTVDAVAAGSSVFELAPYAANETGHAVQPPAFANMTYRYAGSGLTTALITLAPNASDVGSYVLNVTARTPYGLLNHTLIQVNVTDAVPPYFASVPWDIAVEATGSLTAINATALGVVAYDEADPDPTLSHSPAGPLPLGGHYVRWTATDASNNSVSATMYLVVRDTTPPSFEKTANLTLAFAPGVQPVAAYRTPNATDLVDGQVQVSCRPAPYSPIPYGLTTVTCDAADMSGNYAWAQFGINAIRNGTLAPPALAASNSSVAVEYNQTAYVRVNATGAGPVHVELAAAIDYNGGRGNGTVVPPPAFANLTYWYNASSGATTALITLAPNASDVGSYVLNVTARTPHGLPNHTIITVNVTDTVPPYFASVPWDIAVEATGSLTAINATALGVVAYDEADPDPTLSHSPAGPLPVGDHLVRWTATDASNNSASAAMRLFVVDTTPPSFSAVPANASLSPPPTGDPTALYVPPNATDLVDGAVPVDCSPPPSRLDVQDGLILVECDASDLSGNSAAVRFWVNATREGGTSDGGGAQPPRLALSNSSVAVPYNATAAVRASAAGGGTDGPATIELSSIDPLGRAEPAPAFARLEYAGAAGNYTEALITLSPNATDVGIHRINVTAHWRGLLPAHAVLSVNVTDEVPPALHVPARAALEAAGNLTRINATDLGVWAADEADPSPALYSSPSGPLPVGDHHVRWTATDASNNSASAWMRLSVRDTTPPVFGAAPNVTLAFSGGAAPWADYTVPAAFDAVDGGGVRVSCSPPPGSPVQWGLTQVACVALDSQGNIAWARFWLNATGSGGQGG